MLVNPNSPSIPAVTPFPAPARQNNALRIVDTFYCSEPQGWSPPHGSKVVAAARATGYKGPIVPEERLRSSDGTMLATNARIVLCNSSLEPEQTLQAIKVMALGPAIGLLVDAGQSLERATKAGVHGAVTNFSQGLSPASSVESIYGTVVQHLRQGNEAGLQNLARAWNIDFQALTHPDPAVYGPARASFQQRLIDEVQSAYQDPFLQAAQQAFRGVVDAYEAKGNSVVVSAGNDGEVLQQLQADNGGRLLRAKEGFTRNVLATGAVTSVGAQDASFQIVPYSSAEGVNIYAYGQLARDSGTSFAAPRVAAVMAQLHRTHPQWSSAQVESRAEQILSPQQGAIPQEQPHAAWGFMRSQLW